MSAEAPEKVVNQHNVQEERNMWRVMGLSLMTVLMTLLLGACDDSTPHGGAKSDAGDMMFQIDHKRPDEHEKTG